MVDVSRDPNQRLATVKDLNDARARAEARAARRTDAMFAALFLALLGVVAGVGWVLIRSDDENFVRSCRLMQARDQVGAVTARAQARMDNDVAAWHRSEGRRALADAVQEAADGETRLAHALDQFTSADCDDMNETP